MPWYKNFFEKWYLDFWLPEERFKLPHIRKEVVFIKRVLGLSKGAKILDLCCGHGRHLLPLAKAGYQMTGLDLSRKALAILRKEARRQKLKVRIIQGDMRRIPFKNEFDAIINMFTAFGYFKNDREDFKVLKQVTKALKPGGKFLIDLMNRDWLLDNFRPKSWRKIGSQVMLEERKYDPKTSRCISKIQILDARGKWHKAIHVIKVYSLAEMRRNLAKVGLKIIRLYGDTVGNQNFSKTSQRLVILARKKNG